MPDPDASPSSSTGGSAGTTTSVVGIGASAGGLDAFTRLLQHVPADTGYAFVLIQHLDASHPSSLSELLSRSTSMPVSEAIAGTSVQPNHVYIIPPNTALTIGAGVLGLAPRALSGLHLPCDRFLESLAEDEGAGAIGVVLSGNGSDGTGGLLAIKAAGGITFAQDPASTPYRSMPTMAIQSGAADLILSPEGIGAELGRLASRGSRSAGEHATASPEPFREICEVMHRSSGIDFSLYRETSVRRRILRRLALTGATDLVEYARSLSADTAEQAALQRDLLISVTSFFREPAAFDALKRIAFPAIVRARPPNAPIRIWVPGCATGEEAYSLLIALEEFQRQAGTSFPVQLFASDISERSIEHARRGRYPETISAEVSPAQLREHFVPVAGGYQVRKELRDCVVFSRHNLIEDPPFSRLDLISCRNVLIYLDAVQPRIIRRFHYALVDGGFLLLGRSEATHGAEFFAPVEPRGHLFVRKPGGRRSAGADGAQPAAPARPRIVVPPTDVLPRERTDWSRAAERSLLSMYAPPAAVIDDALNVLEIRGDPAPYLTLPSGRTSFNLARLLPDTALFLAVETLVRKVRDSGESARLEHVPHSAGGSVGSVDVQVIPLPVLDRQIYLLVFEATRVASAGEQPDEKATEQPAADPRMGVLTTELAQLRRRLASKIDEQLALDEEHQQITEDTLSANEELKSLAEELETAKEELEATNEELLATNRELEAKNQALITTQELAKAIVETVDIPLLVIDGELIVRHVNAAFVTAFRATASSLVGRTLAEIDGGALALDALRAALDSLRHAGAAIARAEVQARFTAIGTRSLVISGCRLEQLELILLTVQDVTVQREAERSIRLTEEQRRESEKMETVGRLAGGVAHDFNNLLTVILGAAGLASDTLAADHPALDHLHAIHDSAERAASLTEQLLSFSRRKILQPKIFDLNPLTADLCRMLRRVVSEPVTLVERLNVAPCLVRADPAEIGRVVMNLCLNARDAMPAGGILTVCTGHVTLDADAAARVQVPPGLYVQMDVVDTGIGMDADTRQHIFEPFFTTKDVSKGAGLGLAAVFGILRQSGGAIWCESEPGRGARFTVVLPEVSLAAETLVAELHPALSQAPRGDSEVVLLVEDNESVRSLTTRLLERYGYVVLPASSGHAALAALDATTMAVRVLLTDVVMPDMSGGDLARQAISRCPALRVLYMSGHTEDVLVKEGVRLGAAFLQKPFTGVELARKVRGVLDGAQETEPGAPAD